jgi:hypothetical protein
MRIQLVTVDYQCPGVALLQRWLIWLHSCSCTNFAYLWGGGKDRETRETGSVVVYFVSLLWPPLEPVPRMYD